MLCFISLLLDNREHGRNTAALGHIAATVWMEFREGPLDGAGGELCVSDHQCFVVGRRMRLRIREEEEMRER